MFSFFNLLILTITHSVAQFGPKIFCFSQWTFYSALGPTPLYHESECLIKTESLIHVSLPRRNCCKSISMKNSFSCPCIPPSSYLYTVDGKYPCAYQLVIVATDFFRTHTIRWHVLLIKSYWLLVWRKWWREQTCWRKPLQTELLSF